MNKNFEGRYTGDMSSLYNVLLVPISILNTTIILNFILTQCKPALLCMQVASKVRDLADTVFIASFTICVRVI